MNGEGRGEQRVGPGVPSLATEPLQSAWLSTWRNARGQGLSVGEFFAQRPEAQWQKSVVLGVACEEYFRCNEQGEAFDRGEFCRGFPAFQQSVARLLAVYDYLKQNSLLPDRAGTIETWPEPGETVAGYQLLSGLGLGAFSRVYLAAEPAVAHRRVAVKASVEGAAEAEILGKLSHPNIVPVYSVRQDERQRWTLICMPYRGQAALDDVIGQLYCTPEQRPRSARQLLDAVETINRFGEAVEPSPADPLLLRFSYVEGAVHLIAQLADALAYTHAKGICHRDLKPSNVLLAPDGRPMLLDFNLSHDRGAAERRIGGTLPYMAPEQLDATVLEPRAGPAAVDPRSDLFSLGVIAYELLCGEWPYGPILPDLQPDEFATELYERQRGGPAPLCPRNPDVERKLSDLIERCLAFDADARFQTAAELAAELRRCLSLPRRVMRRARAHAVPVAFAAGVLLTMAAGATYHYATREAYGIRELRAAQAALDQRDVTSARRRLDNAGRLGVPAEAKGALAETYYDVGKLAYEQQDYDAARTHLSRAVDLGLKDWRVWFYRGATCYRLEQFGEAAADYEKAGAAGGRGEAYACLGDCVKRLPGRGFREAKTWYLKAVEQGLKNAALFNNLGIAASNSVQPNGAHFEEAEKYFELAIRWNPRLVAPYANRMFVSISRDTYYSSAASDESTIEAARELAARATNNPTALSWAALAYVRGASADDPRREIALAHLRRAFEVGLAVADMPQIKELKEMAETLEARPGFEDLLRHQPEQPEKLVRQYEMLDELGY